MTRIYDLDGTERDAAWLAREYDGCTALPANATGATKVWKLEAVYVTEGPALVKIEARRDGHAADNQPIALSWPSLAAPSVDLDLLPASPHNWTQRAVTARTNQDGIYGAGLGPTFGPFYHAWILSGAPSDCLSKTGMKGGTNHRGPLHGVWILHDVEPVHATLADALLWAGERSQVIQFNPMAALQLRIFAAGFVPNSPEFQQVFNGVTYVAQRAEHLGTGEVRIYYALLGDWGNVTYVTRPS